MKAYRITIRPLSAFGTPIRGDTLFGQLCWTVAELWGERELVSLLDGYLADRPFAVIGDPAPAGWFPRPTCPAGIWMGGDRLDPSARKAEKAKTWVPRELLAEPVGTWRQRAENVHWFSAESAIHNSLDRLTGTTGGRDEFSPYQTEVWRYCDREGASVALDLSVVLDISRLSVERFTSALGAIGRLGYGRDASTGNGRFEVELVEPLRPAVPRRADAWLTLGPCAIQGLEWRVDRCWYSPMVRYGRHGNTAARTGQPLKSPVMLADAGALLTPFVWSTPLFCGRGLGGAGMISRTIEATVHQGYAPILPVAVEAP